MVKLKYKVLKGVEYPKGTVHKVDSVLELTETQAEKFGEGIIEKVLEDPEKVSIKKDVLRDILSTVEGLKEKVQDLEGAANLARLDKVRSARDKGEISKTAKVSIWDKKIVLRWVSVKDDVYIDEQGRIHEDQQIKLYLFEGEGKKPSETEPMSYRKFSRLIEKRLGEVIKETKNQDGSIDFTIHFDDGLEITLPIIYLN